jgi:hypothetical protein
VGQAEVDLLLAIRTNSGEEGVEEEGVEEEVEVVIATVILLDLLAKTFFRKTLQRYGPAMMRGEEEEEGGLKARRNGPTILLPPVCLWLAHYPQVLLRCFRFRLRLPNTVFQSIRESPR